MCAAPAIVSIGDEGILNQEVSSPLADIWIDRDMSWLDFNDRVLAEASDQRTPLLERAKFLAIFTSNLDEFFMKRIAVYRKSPTDKRVQMLAALREKLTQSLKRQEECYRAIISELAIHGIFLRRWDDLTPAQREEADRYFDSQVSPALTPLVFDPAHAFPFLSNLSTSLAFMLYDEEEVMYARVKVPGVVKQWVALESDMKPGEKLMLPLYEIIRGNAHKLYGGMRLTGTTLFRLTRDAEIEIDDDSDEALQDVVREQVRQRRYEPVVRLDFASGADPSIREMLLRRFNLSPLDVYDLPGEVDYTTLFEIASLQIPTLRDVPWNPLPVAAIENSNDIFAAMRGGDIVMHHPYESFEASVEHFIAAAADDPQTVSIKMTAYRIGDDTPFVKSLIKAAEAGKQVACVIEIKARFDEERNLHWAAELERAGAHVTFGVPGLKTHAKIALVVRKETSGLKIYVHLGTGNYHIRTARLYSDIGLLTCDPRITREVVNLFHYLTGNSRAPVFSQLLLAPGAMRSRFLQMIRREIDNKRANLQARIVAKMNQLEDPEVMELLCEASGAGVPVDLIIRGFCCMKPGVPGRTEGIRVRSIIGRFLEHSRIFHFAAGQENPVDGDFYIGSADWMFRNLSKRVEVAAPILEPAGKTKLWEILDICLRDQRQAWMLQSDGTYLQLRPGDASTSAEARGTHQTLMDLARRRFNE
jgi:polyphosphate kinase